MHKENDFKINVGDVVMIKGNDKKRKAWKIRITQDMH